MMPRSQLRRQSLYELVWSQPMTRVAAGLGISDVALKKICIKHDVPVPGRGYWAKVAAGKLVKQPQLSPTTDPAFEEIRIFGAPELQPDVREAKRDAIAREKVPERKIAVNPAPATLHPVAALTLKALRKGRPDDHGLVNTWGANSFSISVAPANVERAVNILDALARAVEERGYTIEPTEKQVGLRIDGELLGFELREKIDRRPHTRTPQEIARAEREKLRRGATEFQFRSWEPQWDYVPSSRLELQLEEEYHTGLRRTWADGRRQRVEELLNDFLAGAVAYAAAEKARREEQERWQREREEEQRRRLAEEARRQREENRWEFLVGRIEALERAERIERFITTTRARISNVGATVQLDRLLNWAQDHAARLRRHTSPESIESALSQTNLFTSEKSETPT